MRLTKNKITGWIALFGLILILTACGGGDEPTSSGSSSSSSTLSPSSGSSTPLTGDIVVDWNYPADVNIDGFSIHVYEDAQLQRSVTDVSLGQDDLEGSFPAANLGNDANKVFWFVVAAHKGGETSKSAPQCFSAAKGVDACS
ncbi:MAG: hypothetical protein ABFR97_06835 [Thermodesulfobacteriota bacterium]